MSEALDRELGDEGKLALHSTSTSAFLQKLTFIQWATASVSWDFQSAFEASICFMSLNLLWNSVQQ